MRRTEDSQHNADWEAWRRRSWVEIACLKFLAAELRQDLERKEGFNPDQPRDDRGRWTDTGASSDQGHQTVDRDASGEEAWDHVVNDWRADGSLAQQMVFNRDGSTIHSEFAAATDDLNWDERHTVVTTDGARIRFETAGTEQTISDANSGEVLGRTVWTDAGPEPQPTLQPAFDPRVSVGEMAVGAAAALFVWLSGKNDSDGTAVFAFKASEFKPGDTLTAEAIWVGRLTREETDAACPRHGEVQSRTDEAAGTVRREGNYMTAAQYGTAVHKNLEGQIKALDDPNFRAEVSLIKSNEEGYGKLGSVRIDVLENVGNGTVCVYDIKTGRSGLGLVRSAEIAAEVHSFYGPAQRIIVIETRPQR